MAGFWWQSGGLCATCSLLLMLLSSSSTTTKCKLSEFTCNNSRCVPINYFCNNINDCGDYSDEPRHCTRCNLTYTGEVEKTYDLELHRPKEDKIPFICHLTFTASGGEYGDLVQLTFDSFTLGRFVSFTLDGCPDGSLQIYESGRPQVSGSWCGTSWGPAIYYSETNSVTLNVNLLRLSKDQAGYNFDYRMEYKYLKKQVSTVRYGGGGGGDGDGGAGGLPYPTNTTTPSITNEPNYFLGDLIAGTYCSRIFSDCDRKHCRLQSPNFPGVYPRNLTCYYAVRQHEIPPGKHVLITVRQPKGQLISIRSHSALYGTASTKELKVWNECDEVQDYVTIYDGYTTRDPIILKFCGGGESVPETTSSGHELLVEFSTSPYGTFLYPGPAQSLHGFQLEVEVTFVDQQSPTYVKNKRQCEFWLRGTNKGVLKSPQHSLPANTTCLYHLQGIDTSITPSPIPFRSLSSRYPEWRHAGMIIPPPRYRVWFSIIKFHVSKDLQKPDTEICRSYLNVWDGQLWTPTNCKDLYCSGIKDKLKTTNRGSTSSIGSTVNTKKNLTLLARYCREHVPRSCEHTFLANGTRFPRPCTLAESYLTTGDSLTLEFRLADSTSLRPVEFTALYEFVDLHLDGEPYGAGPCSRKFNIISQDDFYKFRSPRDVFLYGRGGANNLSCIYRFEAQKNERIKLIFDKVIIKRHDCKTQVSQDTNRLECIGNTTATLRIFEVPWLDVPGVQKDCLCSVDKDKLMPFTYISSSNVLELHFDVLGMNVSDDFTTLYFEGSWKFIRTPTCNLNLRMQGPSGQMIFTYPSQTPEEANCESNPRVIVPSSNKYLYVKMDGFIIKRLGRNGNSSFRTTSLECGTLNRFKIHTAMYTAIICPYAASYGHYEVEIFSEGWTIGNLAGHSLGQMTLDKIEIDQLGRDVSRSISVEFVGKEDGTYTVGWLELGRRRDVPPNGLGLFLMKPDECHFRCPELDACINPSTWCNGIDDCPSGIDEALTNCSILFQLPTTYLFFLFLIILLLSCIGFYMLWRLCRRRPRSILQTRLKSLSSDTAFIDEKGVIC